MRLADLDIDPRLVEVFREQGIDELYPPQAESVGAALAGKNLVLAIPTASGKSLVAYLAILKAVLNGGKAMYIVPLRALAAEKQADLKPFERLGIRVGLTMGDYDAVDPSMEKFDILIATSERADSLLRHRLGWLSRLTVVVADEVHLIHDYDRGPTLEVTLAKMRQVNPRAQIIALSATIRNSAELAAWLEAEHVTSDWRPVPLKKGVYSDGAIAFTDGSVRKVEQDAEGVAALVLDVMAEGGQCLVFVNTRRSTEALARALAKVVHSRLTEKDRSRLQKVSTGVDGDEEETTSMSSRLARVLRAGVAFHNAGLTNAQRSLVEAQFRKGKLKCIVASPTLASGINLPARRVVVRDLHRFDVNVGNAPIPVLEIQQMCGRAGRPRYDAYGEAVLIARDADDVEDLMDEYLRGEPEAIESKLGSEPALRFHGLAVVATGHVATEDELLDFFGRTFFAHCGDVGDIKGRIHAVLGFLEREGFIERRDDAMRPTFFGRRTSDLYIDPLSAVRLRDALRGDRDDPFFHLWAVCATPDMPTLYLRRGDYVWVEEKVTEQELTFPVEDYEFLLAEVKTATLFEDWIAERTEDEITKKFGIGPGDIRRMVDQGEWLLYSMAELGRIFNKKKVRDLTRLMIRVRHGIREELLELVQLQGVGRVRARALWSRGYRTLRDLQKAQAGALAGIPAIGPTLAKKILIQVGTTAPEGPVAGQADLREFPE